MFLMETSPNTKEIIRSTASMEKNFGESKLEGSPERRAKLFPMRHLQRLIGRGMVESLKGQGEDVVKKREKGLERRREMKESVHGGRCRNWSV
jgi:hypothetical protein